MKKNKLFSLFIVLVLIVSLASVVWAYEKKSDDALGKQKNNSGCISCHNGTVTVPIDEENFVEIDITLANEVNTRVADHVELAPGTTIRECMKCHQKENVMDRFKDYLHDVHWNSELLGLEFDAPEATDRCNFCHNMDYIRGYNDSASVY